MELGENVSDVILGRLSRDEELVADLAIRVTSGDEHEHLMLAVGEG
jgi:hypothetical protein